MAEPESTPNALATTPQRPLVPAQPATSSAPTRHGGSGGQARSSGGSKNEANRPFNFDFGLLKLTGNAWFALAVLSIIAVLILPMPRWLLDVSLSFSIAFSLLILVTTLLVQKPIEFSSFPTILLVATLVRLALNVASTRLILTNGHQGIGAAGEVIKAFGSFIMSGNFVIGLTVFIILIIINFVVITKGSGRIAEVSARFTLDAMPGKQMAIDADLSSGLIDEDEAKVRRKELTDESNFYGAMDGASKFVRGDAVAGLIITAINVVGGIIIGVVQSGMTFMDATKTYTYLTVGDGLVSQIPALIVSIGAGMLVTKGASTSGGSGEAMAGQLSKYPVALAMCSGIMAIMAVLPGIPFLPFMLLSVGCGALSWTTFTAAQAQVKQQKIQAMVDAKKEEAKQKASKDDAVETSLKMDEIRLELGFALLPLLKENDGGRPLPEQIRTVRRQLAGEMGFLLPSVRIQDNLQLGSGGYEVFVKEVTSGSGEVRPHLLLVLNPGGGDIDLPGEETVEPSFNLPAKWITADMQETAEKKGYTIAHPATVIITHFTEIIKDHMADLLTISQVQKLIGEQGETYKKLVEEAVPSQITHAGLQRILQNLLRERISIRDLPSILEAILEVLPSVRNVNMITEHVRSRLSRQICQACANEEGVMEIVLLSPEWEKTFQEAVVGEGENRQLALAPSRLQDFMSVLKEKIDDLSFQGYNPVLLTGSSVRPFVRSIVERAKPSLMVLSQNEVHSKARLKTYGQI